MCLEHLWDVLANTLALFAGEHGHDAEEAQEAAPMLCGRFGVNLERVYLRKVAGTTCGGGALELCGHLPARLNHAPPNWHF